VCDSVAISTRGLRKVYRTGLSRKPVEAVQSLDVEVGWGEAFGFLGPNGAGKTTSVMMLLGNVLPTAGAGTLCGYPLGHPAGRKRVGFLPEKFHFHDFLSAAELLDLHGRLHGMSAADRKARVPEVLAMVGLADRARTPVREFSKGMQQRIGLGQALIHDPDLVILDEPTSALDPLGRREVRDLILSLKARGKTVFINSHLLSEIELCCDRVGIMHRGQMIRQGGIAELTEPSVSVEMRIRGMTPALEQKLASFGAGLTVSGEQVSLRLSDPPNVSALAPTIVASGAELLELRPQRETLEELFVRLVGQEEQESKGWPMFTPSLEHPDPRSDPTDPSDPTDRAAARPA
jgi:ABC-2 type transport system ATP-binding protein